ncbi:efflux RND transporter periplasmic adaptor subunit [Hoeflea sp.]|uniref:efflux RND transporter periplasmic adaptor subunit n=1 Tax=Hoeflea sp. TaxID=1940281 RepID=UPI003B52AEB1
MFQSFTRCQRHPRISLCRVALSSVFSLVAFSQLAAAESGNSFQVTVETASAVEYSPEISAFGLVQPDPTRVSTLVSEVGGVVQRVGIRPGQQIVQGDKPVTLFTDPAALSQVVQVRDAIRLAEETLNRVVPLYEKRLVLKSQVDNAQRDLADAQARLEELKSTGALDAEVSPVAPSDGIVTEILVQVGDKAVAGSALLRTFNPEALTIKIGVEAADVQSLSIGMPVEITAITGLEAGDPVPPSTSSTISAIERMVDKQTRLVSVFAVVSGAASAGFLIEQTVKVRIKLQPVSAIRVPRSAIVYQGDSPVVFVAESGKVKRREVSLIDAVDDWVYLKDGVSNGDGVVVSGQTGLTDGATIRLSK